MDTHPEPSISSIWHREPYARSRRPWVSAFLTLAAIALIIIGSLGPWLTISYGPEWAIETEQIRGVNTDGVFSFFFGGVAAILVLLALVQPHLWVVAVASAIVLLLCTMVGLFDWVLFDPMDLAPEGNRQISAVQVEWGLKLLTAAAPVAAICAVLFARALIKGDY